MCVITPLIVMQLYAQPGLVNHQRELLFSKARTNLRWLDTFLEMLIMLNSSVIKTISTPIQPSGISLSHQG